jgi:hypothetical protein
MQGHTPLRKSKIRSKKEGKIMNRAITAVLVVDAIGALIFWVPAVKHVVVTPTVVHAQNGNGGCSVASLSGAYAVSRQGTLLTSVLGLPAPSPWGEVARVSFDGAGSFSGTATVNIGGVVLNSIPLTGTYTVDSDCTGTITVHPNVPVTITEAIVVIGGGQQYIATDTESIAVVQGRGERLATEQ